MTSELCMLHPTMTLNPDPSGYSVVAPPPAPSPPARRSGRVGGGGLSDTFARLATENGWGAEDIDEAIRGLQQVKVASSSSSSASSSKPAEPVPAAAAGRPPPLPTQPIHAMASNPPSSRMDATASRRTMSSRPLANAELRAGAPERNAAAPASSTTGLGAGADAATTTAATMRVASSASTTDEDGDSSKMKSVERERLTARGMQAIFAAAHALHKSGAPPPSPTVAAAAASKAASEPAPAPALAPSRRRSSRANHRRRSSSAHERRNDIDNSDKGAGRLATPAAAVSLTEAAILDPIPTPAADAPTTGATAGVTGAAAAGSTAPPFTADRRDYYAPELLTSPIKSPPVDFPTRTASLSFNDDDDARNTAHTAAHVVNTSSAPVFTNKQEEERVTFGSAEYSRGSSPHVRGRLFDRPDNGSVESPVAASVESLSGNERAARTLPETAPPLPSFHGMNDSSVDESSPIIPENCSLSRDRSSSSECSEDRNGTVAMGGVAVTAFQANSDDEEGHPTLPRPLSPRRRKPTKAADDSNSNSANSIATSQPHATKATPLESPAAPDASTAPTKTAAAASASAEKESKAHNEANALVARGRTLYAQKRYAAAARSYTRALEIGTTAEAETDDKAAADLATAEKANKDVTSRTAKDPVWRAKVLEGRAAAYLKLGNVHLAADDCRTALTLAPDALHVRNYLGAALLKVCSEL